MLLTSDGSKMGKKSMHPLPPSVAENSMVFPGVSTELDGMTAYRMNLRYKKQEISLTRPTVDISKSDSV